MSTTKNQEDLQKESYKNKEININESQDNQSQHELESNTVRKQQSDQHSQQNRNGEVNFTESNGLDRDENKTPQKKQKTKYNNYNGSQQHNYQNYQTASVNRTPYTQHNTGYYQPLDGSMRDTSGYNSRPVNHFRNSQFTNQNFNQPLNSASQYNQQQQYSFVRPHTSASRNDYQRTGGSPQRVKSPVQSSNKRSTSQENAYNQQKQRTAYRPHAVQKAHQNKENQEQVQPREQSQQSLRDSAYCTEHYNIQTRDAIAASYRQEIRNLQNCDKDFAQLIKTIQETEKRKQLAEQSFMAIQQENERQLQSQAQMIQHLETDFEAVKKSNYDNSNECARLQQLVQDTSKELHNADIALYGLRQEREKMTQQNSMTSHEIDALKNQVKEGIDYKSNQQQKIYQLQHNLNQITNECNAQSNKAEVSKTELDQLIQSEQRLAEVFQQKSMQFDDEAVKHEVARTEIQRLVAENHCLETDVTQGKNRNNYLLEVQRDMIKQRDQDCQRGNELNAKLSQLQHQLSVNDQEAHGLNQDIDATKHNNDHLLQGNNGLKEELAALQKHANLIQLQNKDLQRELDEFVITDDIIRSGLDRREKVDNIRQRVKHAIHGSQTRVDSSKSPLRKNSGFRQQNQYETQPKMHDITNFNNNNGYQSNQLAQKFSALNIEREQDREVNNQRETSPVPYRRTQESKGSPLRSSNYMNNY